MIQWYNACLACLSHKFNYPPMKNVLSVQCCRLAGQIPAFVNCTAREERGVETDTDGTSRIKYVL